jgi:lambda repressor-like predicted transcriptional regulator
MARRKNWSAEQIVAKLRQIEVQLAQGKSLALVCKEAEISEQSSRTSASSGRSSTAYERRRW